MNEATSKQNVWSMEREVEILNVLGLHARPAMQFVDTASRYASQITIRKDNLSVNGKDLMDLMMLAATQGTRLRIRAEGPDAADALDALHALVLRKFDEEN